MLAIVGVIVGAIWYSAETVNNDILVEETMKDILQIARGSQRLFPVGAYPTVTNTMTAASNSALKAGVIPSNYQYVSATARAKSPLGVEVFVGLGCYSYCPQLGVAVMGRVDTALCNQLIRRIASKFTDNSDLLYIQVTSSPMQFYYLPLNLTTVNCPSSVTDIYFWFKPS